MATGKILFLEFVEFVRQVFKKTVALELLTGIFLRFASRYWPFSTWTFSIEFNLLSLSVFFSLFLVFLFRFHSTLTLSIHCRKSFHWFRGMSVKFCFGCWHFERILLIEMWSRTMWFTILFSFHSYSCLRISFQICMNVSRSIWLSQSIQRHMAKKNNECAKTTEEYKLYEEKSPDHSIQLLVIKIL